MIEIILAVFLGFIIGVLCGFIPGIHPNLILVIVISISISLSNFFSPLSIVCLIVSLSFSNIFFEFIQSTYLGVPNEDTALSTTPAHEFVLKGNAHYALKLLSTGALSGILLLIITLPITILLINETYSFLEKMMGFLIISLSIFLIAETKKPLMALIVFISAGFLGFSSFNMNLSSPLLPLLTGLFGTSSLIFSLKENTSIPPQNNEEIKINKKIFYKPFFCSALISPICSFLPGLGNSQATILGSKLTKELSREEFLILNGNINFTTMIPSFVTLLIIGKARTGAANAIENFIQITNKELILIILISVFVSIASYYTVLKISKSINKKIDKINYPLLSKIVILFLILVVFLVSGFTGIIVLISSTLLGLFCQYVGIRKGILMGCLLIPTAIYYFPF